MKTYEIDGERFSILEEFYDEIDRALNLAPWGRNLNAFNDILRGGFGTPEEGFVIRWKNHAVSKERLGYSETARLLELQLGRCDPANRASISSELEDAKAHKGQTAFEWLIAIIQIHGKGGREAQDGIELILE